MTIARHKNLEHLHQHPSFSYQLFFNPVPAVKMLDQATCGVKQNELAIPIWNTNLSSSYFFQQELGGESNFELNISQVGNRRDLNIFQFETGLLVWN